jgi:tetratricopeptide (TPR) repeat protein
VCLFGVWSCDIARWSADAARSAAVVGDWSAAAEGFEAATSAHPGDAAYWLGLGLARAATNQTDPAREAYERARTLSPGDPRGWAGLALLSNDPAQRARLLAEAARRTTDPTYSLRLGDALAAAGDPTNAIQAYARAVALGPDLYPLFPERAVAGQRPQRATVAAAVPAILDRIAHQATISPDAVLWDFALADDRLPADAGPAWRAVDLVRMGNRDGALAALAEANRVAPYDGLTLDAELAVARLTCDRPTYDRVVDWLGPYHVARPAKLTIIREHVYREDALSSYLPPSAEAISQDERWPWAFIGDPPACPAWFGAGEGK